MINKFNFNTIYNIMDYLNAFRTESLSVEEMKGRICTCPETGTPDEYGDGSSLPCMSPDNGMFGQPILTCDKCIYCNIKPAPIKS